MKSTTARRNGKNKLDSYFALVKQFPLVSIKDEKQFWAAEKFMHRMLRRGKLDSGEQQYFDALCINGEHVDDSRNDG